MGFLNEPAADPWQDRLAQVERIADRLRSLGVDRLGRAGEDDRSLADVVHAICASLAALTQRLTGAPAVEPPRLADLASGDQFTVVATECIAATRERARDDQAAADLIDASLRDLRRRL